MQSRVISRERLEKPRSLHNSRARTRNKNHMLIEQTLFGERDMVKTAIDRIRQFEPPEGYYVAFSGGKDSVVILDLVRRSGVKYDAHYNLTTVDPPELVKFVRTFADVKIEMPVKTMWQLIVERRLPPTRIARYCCAELKEHGGLGRRVVTGVRWAESVKRSRRKMVEHCQRNKSKTYLHPIIDWSDEHVWEYINANHVRYCKLYNEGQKRIGCIMCPLSGKHQMEQDAARYPKFAAAYTRAMTLMIDKRRLDGLPTTWDTGEECFQWWVSNVGQDAFDNQLGLCLQ